MKNRFILILIFSMISIFGISQNSKGIERISWVSEGKDTLILLDNDLGHMIACTWDIPKYAKKKPIIIFMKDLPNKPSHADRELDRNFIDTRNIKNKG